MDARIRRERAEFEARNDEHFPVFLHTQNIFRVFQIQTL